MSHSTKVELVPILDIRALRSAQRELREQGIDCELLEHATPRMFFKDQLRTQLGQASDVCDYVLRLNHSSYDVGFLKEADGSYMPVFDAYQGHVAQILGCDPSGVEPLEAPAVKTSGGWGQDSRDGTFLACNISKLLMAYTKHATINQAVAEGDVVESAEYDENGKLQIWLQT